MPGDSLNLLSICTGAGGLDLGVELAIPSARPVLYIEREAYACGRLVAAMEEGRLASAPIWTDATTFAGRRWRGLVDGLVGGIPCQPHSLAGKRAGADDERDLWSDARRIIVQARPWFVLIENVPGMLTAKPGQVPGAERVRRDLHRLGFAVEGGLFSAEEMGFSHERERVFILGVWGVGLADAPDAGPQGREPGRADPVGQRPAAERDGSDLGAHLGVDLVDPEGERRGKGRPQHELRLRGGSAADAGREVGDADRTRRSAPRAGSLQHTGQEPEPGCGDVVHTLGRDLDRRPVEPQRGSPGRGTAGWASPLPLHAPGPDDIDGWRAVLAERPELAPALPQSALRELAHGMDRPRIDELRLGGNGVVPLVGGYALRTLATRLAARGSAGAALLVQLMEAA